MLLFLMSVLAVAGEPKVAPGKEAPAQKKVSLQPEFRPYDVSPTSVGSLPEVKAEPAMKVTTGCTTASGITYQANDPGYDTCLSQLKMKSYGEKKDDKAGTSVNFKFGN